MDTIRLDLPGWCVEAVGDANRAELQRLFTACEDYVRLTEGRAPSAAQVDDLLLELPPGRAAADKHALAVRAPDGRLAGVVDVVRGYPAPDAWFIGLLLLDPAERGRGLGDRVHEAVEAWVRAQGAAALWLAVLEQNPDARRFWERLGYLPVDEKRIRIGERESVAVRMMRRFGQGEPPSAG